MIRTVRFASSLSKFVALLSLILMLITLACRGDKAHLLIAPSLALVLPLLFLAMMIDGYLLAHRPSGRSSE